MYRKANNIEKDREFVSGRERERDMEKNIQVQWCKNFRSLMHFALLLNL